MKKIFTLAISLGFTFATFAQTQRMVLTEEFTNASCPPCASQNPAFNALIADNPTKIVAIKYQTNFPGADPMNAQTQTDVAPRLTYYSVNGVPYAPINGDTLPLFDWAGNGYTGGPYHYTQEMIDSAYASPAPFSLSITHTISSDLDSIYITATVTAAQALSGLVNPKLRIGIIEREIVFDSAPGTNGETEFYDVMRKMVPNSNGTTVGTSWTNGQSQTFTFGIALPTFIYDLLQVRVVGFIQTDGDKVVHQAAISAPFILSNYASISNVNTVANTITCNTSITPSITIENYGANPLTSAVVSYSIDGGTALTENFTGNIATGTSQSLNINTPISNLTPGEHTIIFQLQNINNAGINSTNISSSFFVIGAASALNNYTENFATATGFNSYINISDDAVLWSRSTTAGFGIPRNSMKIDFYNSPLGKVDDVILPPFNTSGLNEPKLNFKVAGAPYPYTSGDSEDTLEVHYSLDCGSTWNLAWRKSGADLYTVAGQTNAYTANNDAAFRNDSTVLTGAGNSTQLLVMFRARSGYGNNVYVDNINIRATSALVSVSSTPPTCNGGTNGSAVATAIFGTAPYTYLWNTTPAQTTQTAINLAAGVYSVTVTDQSGSSNTSSVSIGQPAVISAASLNVTNQSNSTPNGGISFISSGGTQPYTYSWSNGATTNNLTGLSTGNYSVTITDANGCTKTQTFVVNASSDLLAVTFTAPSCNGGTNGTAQATPNFGNPPYTYSWNTNPTQTTQSATNLLAGNYSVTVTDGAGSTSINSITISQPALISTSSLVVTNQTNSTPNGAISFVSAGGTSPYTYLWSNGSTTESLSGLTADTYSVTITDANGCTKTQSFTVSNTIGVEEISSKSNLKLYPNPAQNNLNIVIENVQSNGTISIVDAIGKNVYSSSIEGKGKVFTTIDLTNITNGIYFVRVNSGSNTSIQKLIVKH
jgi:hypothetical protein